MVNRVKIIFVNGKEEMGNLKIINKKGVGISKNKFVDLFLVGVGFLSKLSKYFGEGKCINVSKKKENSTNVALTVKHKVLVKLNKNNNYLDFFKKKKEGSNALNGINRMEPNRLIPDYDYFINTKYLNVSVELINCRAEMVEWLTQSVDTRYPSGCVGFPRDDIYNASIPTLGAIDFVNCKIKGAENE